MAFPLPGRKYAARWVLGTSPRMTIVGRLAVTQTALVARSEARTYGVRPRGSDTSASARTTAFAGGDKSSRFIMYVGGG